MIVQHNSHTAEECEPGRRDPFDYPRMTLLPRVPRKNKGEPTSPFVLSPTLLSYAIEPVTCRNEGLGRSERHHMNSPSLVRGITGPGIPLLPFVPVFRATLCLSPVSASRVPISLRYTCQQESGRIISASDRSVKLDPYQAASPSRLYPDFPWK